MPFVATAICEIQRHACHERLFVGSIATSETPRILILPSIDLILHRVMPDKPIPGLHPASIPPGLELALLISLTVWIACRLRPDRGGRAIRAISAGLAAGLPHLLPVLCTFVPTTGSIHARWATPTGAATPGVPGALPISAMGRSLIRAAFAGTIRITQMLMNPHHRGLLPECRVQRHRPDRRRFRTPADT